MNDKNTRREQPATRRAPVLVLSGMLASVPIGMDLQLPALPEIANYFSSSTQLATLSVPLFFLGNTLGQFLGGPLSDQLGRRSIGIFGITLSLLACVGIIFAGSVEAIIVLRTLQGVGAGAANIIAFPTLRDTYSDNELGTKIASTMLGVMTMMLLAPFLGALLVHISWQAVYIAMSLMISLLLFLYVFLCPETLSGKRTLSLRAFYRSYHAVFTAQHGNHKLALRYLLMMATTIAVNLSFVTSSVFIYREYFGVAPFEYSVLFTASILCMALCAAYARRQIRLEKSSFECLGKGLRAQLFMVFIFVLTLLPQQPSLSLVAPALILASGFTGLVMPHGMTLYLSLQESAAGSAMSGSTASNFLLSGVAGLIIAYLHNGTPLPAAIVMLVLAVMANLLYFNTPSAVAKKYSAT